MKTQVSNLKAGLATVIAGIAEVRSGSNLKRQHIVEALGIPTAKLTPLTKELKSNKFKSYPDVLQLRDSVRASCTTCLNLSEQVAAGRIKPRELMEKLGIVAKSFEADIKLAESCISYLPSSRKVVSLDDVERNENGTMSFTSLQDVTTAMYEQEANEKVARREEREDAATIKTSRTLQRMKDTFSHKVPRTFKDTSIKIVQLPVMARFGTLAMSPDSLSRMGFKIHTAGLHSTPSSDLGIIFENQLLLFFRLSDAKELAASKVKLYKERDGALSERKVLQKKRGVERRSIKKLQAQLEETRALKAMREIRAQIAECEGRIDQITQDLDQLDSRVRLSNSNARAFRQVAESNDHAMLNYLNPIVDTINAKSSSDLGLMTTMPLRGVMKDSDVMCAWLMEKSAIRLLLRHCGGDMKLQNWFLPWTNG